MGKATSGSHTSGCYNTGKIEGERYIGGIIGASVYLQISYCHNIGAIIGSGNCIGGIVGNSQSTSVISCYNVANVEGATGVGGIIAYNYNDAGSLYTVTDCYSIGDIKGSSKVGGVIGYFRGSDYLPIVSRCYSVGAVSGSSDIGGVFGEQMSNIEASYCFYDSGIESGVSGAANGSDNGTNYCGLTTEMMQGDASTSGTLLYYFTNEEYGNSTSWAADTEGENGGYPVLINSDND